MEIKNIPRNNKKKMKVIYTKPMGGFGGSSGAVAIKGRMFRYIALGLVVVFTIGFTLYSFKRKREAEERERLEATRIAQAASQEKVPPPVEEPEEVELPIIDLSEHSIALGTDLQRINEPIPYDGEVLYSAGNSENIDEPVFKDLYLMNVETGEEKSIAQTEIKFGEIYEGRFNGDWVTWLDTNQCGENQLYVLDRGTEEISKIKTCEFNKPQLRLAGDNLVWVEQKDLDQDRLYLYNFKSGEPVVLEIFDNPTYGTCPPSISEELLVWVVPSEEDPENTSLIKVLDLSKALSVELGNMSQGGEDEGQSPEEGIEMPEDEGVDPVILDPKGFAIYPATYGKAIAWLDNLDPSNANLMLTIDNGRTIINVAQGVARPYGIGEDFIAYMKDDCVMVYFWELDRHGQLNKPGTKARLTQGGVYGNRVVWYSADNPNQKNDELFISLVDRPTQEQLSESK